MKRKIKKKLHEIISPEQFRALADFLDVVDKKLHHTGEEVQNDLREFADALELQAKS